MSVNKISFLSKFAARIRTPFKVGFKIGGYFDFTARDKDGRILWKERVKNGMTNSGLDNILNTYFGDATQTAIWYGGLIDNASFSALASSDTMASHAGWIENVGYSETVRQTWGVGASSGQSVTNSSPMVYTASTSIVIKGGFLTSVSTKSGTSGILLATGAFASNQSLTTGQTLDMTYTNTATGS
jgi:hypothetical protein